MSVVEIKIPSPGESITEVTIETWHKADGEFVQVDEILCENCANAITQIQSHSRKSNTLEPKFGCLEQKTIPRQKPFFVRLNFLRISRNYSKNR